MEPRECTPWDQMRTTEPFTTTKTGSLRDRLFLLEKEHVRLKDLDLFQCCPHVVQIWPTVPPTAVKHRCTPRKSRLTSHDLHRSHDGVRIRPSPSWRLYARRGLFPRG